MTFQATQLPRSSTTSPKQTRPRTLYLLARRAKYDNVFLGNEHAKTPLYISRYSLPS